MMIFSQVIVMFEVAVVNAAGGADDDLEYGQEDLPLPKGITENIKKELQVCKISAVIFLYIYFHYNAGKLLKELLRLQFCSFCSVYHMNSILKKIMSFNNLSIFSIANL